MEEKHFFFYVFIIFASLIFMVFIPYILLENNQEKKYAELVEKEKKSELTLADYDSFKDKEEVILYGYYKLLYLDTYGEIPSYEEPKMYKTFVGDNKEFDYSFKQSLGEVYTESFEKMRSRLGLPNLGFDTLGDLIQVVHNQNQLNTFDKFELVQRYGLTIYYNQELFNSVYFEQIAFIDEKRYMSANKDELLLMAAASYGLLANVEQSKYPHFSDFVIAASTLYYTIYDEGVDSANVKEREQAMLNAYKNASIKVF